MLGGPRVYSVLRQRKTAVGVIALLVGGGSGVALYLEQARQRKFKERCIPLIFFASPLSSLSL